MNIYEGLTYDDVLLVPRYSEVETRSNVDLSVDLGKGVKLDIPIITANMADVTGPEMARAVAMMGGLGLLHRFCTLEQQVEDFKKAAYCEGRSLSTNIGASLGVKEEDKERLDALYEAGCRIFCIDVAHGHNKNCGDMTSYVAKKYSDVLLISGNVATPEGAQYLADCGADVCKTGVGPGCFAAGTRVLMSNGTYKNIEQIVPGDRVINKDGNPVNVKASVCTGYRKVNKFRHTLSHKYTYVTSDHNYWVGDISSTTKKTISNVGYAKILDKQSKTKPKQSKYKWKEISQMNNESAATLMPRRIDFEMNDAFEIILEKRYSGNNSSNFKYKIDNRLTPNYDLGYVFGTFLGDGCASLDAKNSTGSVKWYFGKNEKDVANKLSNSIKNIFNKEVKINNRENIIDVTLYYKPLAKLLYSFGKKKNKHLPNQYLCSNKDYLSGIIDGLVDSDGHKDSNGRIRFTNTSEQLIELFNICNYIINGVFPNNEKQREPSSGRLDNCDVNNCNDGYRASVNITGVKRLTKDYQVAKIMENEETNLEIPVYDIEVDCDTHSFIANNAIVHNSLCSTRVETGNGVPQLTALQQTFMDKQNRQMNYKIIADGGLKKAGDLTKALCFADAVMLGSLLAGTNEAPGQNVTMDGVTYKQYRGSSTLKDKHIEGVQGLVPLKGPVEAVIEKLLQGLKSGCSYQGVNNLTDLKKSPTFVKISNSGLLESHPHSVILK